MPLQRYLFSIVKSQKDTTLQDLREKFDIRQLARTPLKGRLPRRSFFVPCGRPPSFALGRSSIKAVAANALDISELSIVLPV